MNADHKSNYGSSKQFGEAFSAIGSAPRIEVFLTIVNAVDEELTIGLIQEITQIPASTLAHHLRFLVDAKLITQEKVGRKIINKANLETIKKLSGFLTEVLRTKEEGE